MKYVGQVDTTELTNFFNYWSEACGKKDLMRWEMEKTWETKKRLDRWMKNQYTSESTAAAIRLERTKGKESEQAKVTEQQQDEAERRKDEEAKARRMDSRDYVKINPNGFLAKLQREEERKNLIKTNNAKRT